MRRIMVMGPPGSGKSTLARQLGTMLELPVFHLDQYFHLPGWVAVAPERFDAEVERMAGLPGWVIDGNYLDTIAARYRNADCVIYLDISRWLSIWRVFRRTVMSQGRVRQDSAAGCPERFSFEFMSYVWHWNRIRRARHLALVEGFAGEKIVLYGLRQQRRFLKEKRGGL